MTHVTYIYEMQIRIYVLLRSGTCAWVVKQEQEQTKSDCEIAPINIMLGMRYIIMP